MNKDFATYLEKLGVSSDKPLFAKADRLLELAKIVGPEEAEDIFVSEFTKEDGSREFTSLWMFTPRYVMEARDFPGNNDKIDTTYIKKAISYVEVESKDYNLKEAGDSSRVSISVLFTHSAQGGALTGRLRASKKNCDDLVARYVKYFKPNIVG